MKKAIIFFMTLFFVCTTSVFAQTNMLFTEGWNTSPNHFTSSMTEIAMYGVASAPYKEGFVVSNLNEEELYKEEKLNSTLTIYSLVGKVEKSITIENKFISLITTSDENIFVLALEIETEEINLIKFNSELIKEKEITIDMSFEDLNGIIYSTKFYGISSFVFENDSIYFPKNSSVFSKYDKDLNYVADYEYEDDSICEELSYYCQFGESGTESIMGYDENENYKVYSGSAGENSLLRLYNGETEVFTTSYYGYIGILGATIVDNKIVAMGISENGTNILLIDFYGNILQTLNTNEYLFNYTLNKKTSGLLVVEPVLNDTCPEYINDTNCFSAQFQHYYLGLEKNRISYPVSSMFTGFVAVEETTTGDYITAINAEDDIDNMINQGKSDAYLIKYDKKGNVIWETNFSGAGSDKIYDLIATEQDEYIIVGISYSSFDGTSEKEDSDATIMKVDKDGNIKWSKRFGGSSYDGFEKVIKTEDGYIAIGNSSSTDIENFTNKGDSDAIVVKYDFDGNVVWQKNWGGSSYDIFYHATITKDSKIVLVGKTSSHDIAGLTHSSQVDDGIIVKLDENGNLLWQKIYSMDNALHTQFVNVIELNDGHLMVAASNAPEDTASSKRTYVLAQFNENGDLLNRSSFKGNDFGDKCFKMIKTDDNGLIISAPIVNNSSINTAVGRLDSDFNIVDFKVYGGYFCKFSFDLTNPYLDNYVMVGFDIDFELQSSATYLEIYDHIRLVEKKESTNGTYELTQEGELSKIVLSPDKGYVLDKLSITDNEGKEVEYYEKDGAYYFKTSNLLSVNVTYKEEVINPNTITFLKLGFIAVIIFAIYNLFITKKIKVNRYV